MPRKCFPGSNDSMQKTKQKKLQSLDCNNPSCECCVPWDKTAAKVKKKRRADQKKKREGGTGSVSLSQETHPSFWTNMH